VQEYNSSIAGAARYTKAAQLQREYPFQIGIGLEEVCADHFWHRQK
jgi:hypothetical protein